VADKLADAVRRSLHIVERCRTFDSFAGNQAQKKNDEKSIEECKAALDAYIKMATRKRR